MTTNKSTESKSGSTDRSLTMGMMYRLKGRNRWWKFIRRHKNGDLLFWGPVYQDGRATKYGGHVSVRIEDVK